MGGVRVQVDGQPATAAVLLQRALVNYGHFTTMQVRAGAVRGLDLHLHRLDAATRELFDRPLDPQRVRRAVRSALAGGEPAATVRVDVFGQADVGSRPDPVSVMVTVRPPAAAPERPQRLFPVGYQRPLAHLKHVGTFAQHHFGRLAERHGCDEALFTDPDGAVYEGSVTNIGFVAGGTVVWPDGPLLVGTAMQLLEAALPGYGLTTTRRPVHLSEVTAADAVFVTNSRGVAPVAGVVGVPVRGDPDLLAVIQGAYEAVPFDPI